MAGKNTVADGRTDKTDKRRMTAVYLVGEYPFARFMTEKQIDRQTSLVKPGVNINAVMLGFGETNRSIFLASVANNQFITETERGTDIKKVRYFIFDDEYAAGDKNLNDDYGRYRTLLEGADESEYLPLPAMPAEESFFSLDIAEEGFYDQIGEICTASDDDANFVVIDCGSDSDNLAVAQKLSVKRREWGVKNLIVFVIVRGKHEGHKLANQPDCYLIAEGGDDLLVDKISEMAQMRNEIYALEYELTQSHGGLDGERIAEITKKARERRYTAKSQNERDSGFYGCLSLRSKLNLMGLDYLAADAISAPALTEEEYLDIYAGGDRPDAGYYPHRIDGKPIVHYTLDFPKSRRRDLAVHEHLRWNAFMISRGMIPATKKQILEEEVTEGGRTRKTNGKSFSERRHGNLTTFDGLVEYRKMIAERDRRSEEETDVIKYDYQLLDDAYWLLSKNGFKIVRLK